MNRSVLSALSVLVLIIGAAVFFGVGGNSAIEKISLSAEQPTSGTTMVRIGKERFVVELAVTPEQHGQGLSERQSLPKGTGMLFVFDQARPVSFWMRKMEFSLDMVWIRDGKVVGVERNVPPPPEGSFETDLPHYSAGEAVSHVLEINAGEASSIKAGDKVTIQSINGI